MKKLPLLLMFILFLISYNLKSLAVTIKGEPAPHSSSSVEKSVVGQNFSSAMDEDAISYGSNPGPQRSSTGFAAFSQLDLIPNIETIGVVVSGVGLPKTAELQYRQNGEANWRTGHPLVSIDDGRLVGSLFGLFPSTSYEIKVLDGTAEISGSTITQPVELQFTPSIVLHVNDDAPASGDGSIAAPFKTIQEAVNRASPGTQVLVADGVYREAVTFPASGSAGNWIQVKAEGNGAVLDGSEILSGNIWTQEESKPRVWFTKIGASIGYLARDQKRFYMYDNLSGLMSGTGHNKVSMNEGWYIEPFTWKLYVRSLDDPSKHTWQAPRLNHAFDVDSRDWIWIEGFEMRYYGIRTDGCGVCAINASHLVIRKNKIHNMQLGIFINWNGGEAQGNDTRIEQNEIYDPPVNEWPWNAVKTSSMEGTAIVLRGHIGAIVRDNEIHNYFNGIYTGSSGALENPGVAFDADIYNNHIHHISDDGLEPEGACVNHRFRNNTIDNALVGISLAPITQGPTWVMRSLFTNYFGRAIKWDRNSDGAVFVYHNTSWTNVKDVDAMGLISTVHNAVLRNNIFLSNGYAFQEVPTGSTGNDWNNDNWHTTRALDGPHFKWENVSYDTIAKLCATTELECKGYEDSPGLSNPGGGDFTLLSSSPNIDRGVVIPGINDQFSGGAPDVGAFERVIDSSPVVLSIVRADKNPTGSASVNFTVTFSEPVTGVDVLAPFNDFVLGVSGVTDASVTNVASVSGAVYKVGVNTGSGGGTVRLDLADNDSIVDATGNSLGGAGTGNGSFNTGEVYAIEKSLPMVSGILITDPNPIGVDNVHFVVNFSREVSGVDAGDFALVTTGGISGAAIGDISGSGTSYTVVVATGAGDGTLRLDIVDNDSIVDSLANPLGGPDAGNGNFTSGGIYIFDKTAPVIISSLRTDPNPTIADTLHFMLTFSEAVSGVDVSDLQLVTTDSLSGVSITGLSGSANIYTVTAATGAGVGNLRLDVVDDDSIVDALGHPLGGVGAGNGSFSAGEAYTINKPPVTIISEVYSSVGSYDGWILESGEDSNMGGSKDSNATTFNLGDDARDRQYRSILHFPTNTLPDNAVVTQAILMIRRQVAVGTDPFITHQNITMDIRNGVFGNFGPFSIGALQAADFQAPASRNSVGVIRNNPVGDWYWSLLDAAAYSQINLVGATQIRLFFQTGDNDDRGNDYLKFFSGNARTLNDRPQLLIKYYVP